MTTIRFQWKTVYITTVVSQNVLHFGKHLEFFENYVFGKFAANVLEITVKQAFELDRKLLDWKLHEKLKKETRTNFLNSHVFYSNLILFKL